MGQANLVRLEKINNSMFWESGALFNNNYWATTKYIILFKYIYKSLFFTKKTFWKFLWTSKKGYYSAYATSMKPVNNLVNQRLNYFLPKHYNKKFYINKILLAFYIYQLNNKNYLFFILTQPKIQKLYIKKKKREKIKVFSYALI